LFNTKKYIKNKKEVDVAVVDGEIEVEKC